MNPVEPKVSIVTMTPALADRLLSGNTKNRRLAPSYVTHLIDQMKAGRWRLNNDAICVAPDGRLLNGQHRLSAVYHSGCSVPMVLTENLPEEAFLTMDIGRGRSATDVTSIPSTMVADMKLVIFIASRSKGRTSPHELLDLAPVWRPIYDNIVSVNGKPAAGLSNSGLRVGAGLRYALESDPVRRLYVLNQYRALTAVDLDHASKAIRILYKRLANGIAAYSYETRMRIAAIVYYHFDPDRAMVEPIIKSEALLFEEVRHYLQSIQDAFLMGPDSTGHPYVWATKPKINRVLTGAAKAQHEARLRREATA